MSPFSILNTSAICQVHGTADPDTTFIDLGAQHYDTRGGTQRAIRNHVRHLEALGYTVTLHAA